MLFATYFATVPRLLDSAVVDDPVDLIEDGNLDRPFPATWTVNVAKAHIISGEARRFPKVLHLEYEAGPNSSPESTSIKVRTTGLVHLADTVGVFVWMRGDPKQGASNVKVRLLFQQFGDVDKTLIDHTVTLTPTWKEYRFAAASDGQILPDEAKLTMIFGYGPGIVDLARLRVQELGDVSPSSVRATPDATSKKSGS